MDAPADSVSIEHAAAAFAAEVAHWRDVKGWAKRALALKMGFDPSYVSHVESGRHPPTEDFARKADLALGTGSVIWQRWREYDAAKSSTPKSAGLQWTSPETVLIGQSALVVEHDVGHLDYDGITYRPSMRRLLRNVGAEPVTRFLARINVDRYPGEPERSNAYYRQDPLTFDEIELTAACGGEPMRWEVKQDLDALKEVWFLFENSEGRFPLYPGQSVWITYGYKVGQEKWGHWFQRAVRLPTERLEVQLSFPTALDPVVWGIETSMTANARPLPTSPTETIDGERTIFTWSTTAPPLHTRYRMEWRFRAQSETTSQT
ncbi:multiprotein-bridging factor 1 family protein [Nocardia sp. NPDC049149]|uniref:helix-turn-helix domain-containing protein n=1 Tax=Nocardia sp. NPDC049149 TaxID=3364315 RepID=UPI003714D6C1